MTAAWICHGWHDQIVSFVPDVEERKEEVLQRKPLNERQRRLEYLSRPIPEEEIPAILRRAAVRLDGAIAEYKKAWAVYDYASAANWAEPGKADNERGNARASLDSTWLACTMAEIAFRGLVTENLHALQDIHAKYCLPECTWDGSQVVFP